MFTNGQSMQYFWQSPTVIQANVGLHLRERGVAVYSLLIY